MTTRDSSILWPVYMNAQAWQDLSAVLDEVFGTEVHAFANALFYLRSSFLVDYEDGSSTLSPDVAAKVQNRELISAQVFTVYDETTERLRLNQLGLPLMNPSVVEIPVGTTPTLINSPVHRLTQNIGAFWYSKGKASFIDFIAYCMNYQATMNNLWSQDYQTFYQESELPVDYVPIWNGGPWFPTTHVRIALGAVVFDSSQLRSLQALFYDIANYNLVLESITQEFWSSIVDSDTYARVQDGSLLDTAATGQPLPANVEGFGFHLSRIEVIQTPLYTITPVSWSAVVIAVNDNPISEDGGTGATPFIQLDDGSGTGGGTGGGTGTTADTLLDGSWQLDGTYDLSGTHPI